MNKKIEMKSFKDSETTILLIFFYAFVLSFIYLISLLSDKTF